jgi:TolB-like protein/Tfp pilus assembly protein PilF
MARLKKWLSELKRRKVLRVLSVYVLFAWGTLQVADGLFPVLLLPPWTLTFVAVLLLIGLPVTAIIAWAFEITPDGVRLTPTAVDGEAVQARAGWLEGMLLLAIVAVLGVSVARFVDRGAAPAVALPDSERHGASAAGSRPGDAAEHAPVALQDVVPANSIAVLPFTSFSDDPDSNYFADGLTEELINSLAHISELKVSGRTSSFYYKNRNEDLRQIGRQLGVSHVLEGSVRRAGDQLRITVQLIAAADGFHLWSQTYDRRMDDILAIQDDVAEHVAAALEVKLNVGRDPGEERMADPEDYRRYLIATALLRERSLEPLTRARDLFVELRSREPDNVGVLAGLAQATLLLAGTYMTLDFDPAAAEALAAVERALAIDPDSVAANVAAGAANTMLLHRTDERGYRERAERHLARAVELAPNDPDALAAYGTLLNEIGRHAEALDVLRAAVVRDPLSRLAQAQLIMALEGLGRLAEARDGLLNLMQIYPDYLFAQLELGELLLAQGQIDAALPYLRRAHEMQSSPRATFVLANAYLNLGLEDEMRAVLGELAHAPLSAPFAEVILLAVRGDDAGAFRLAQTQLSATGDPIWRALLIRSALQLGDLASARRELVRGDPTLLTELDATRVQPEAALFAGELLVREGQVAEATRLLEGLLAGQAAPAQGYDAIATKMVRAKALALLGRRDAAFAELRAAHLQGNRQLWDFDYFQRIDRDAAFASMRDDPRFRALVAEIEADNRAMRDRVLHVAGRMGSD